MLNQLFKTSGYILGYLLLSLILSSALILFMTGLMVIYPLLLVFFSKEISEADTWLDIKIPLLYVIAFIPLLVVSSLLYLVVLSQLIIIPVVLMACSVRDSFEEEEETFISAFEVRIKSLMNFYLDPIKNLRENSDSMIVTENLRCTLLTEEELKKAAALANDSSTNPKLSGRITRYTTLLAQLQQLDKAIVERDQRVSSLTDFNPTVTYTYDQNKPSHTIQITLPALFFKQFRKNDQWKVVPGSTKVCDAQKIQAYTLFQNSNPFDQSESLSKPKPYKNYPTRYFCSLYKGEADELFEVAKKIKNMI